MLFRRQFLSNWLSTLALIISLTGCFSIIDSCPSCVVPGETRSEISLLGVTMANRFAFSDSIGQRYYEVNGEPHVYGSISLIFSPKEGLEVFGDEGILLNSLSLQPYHFTFSEFSNSEFIEINAADEVNSRDPEVFDAYGGHLLITSEFSALEVGGADHTLSTKGVFRAPARATHVTLWFQETETSSREFVRRMELTSLTAWNLYFQPLIDERL